MENIIKKKILIVEDDGMISSMYKIKLEIDGFKVIIANNGAEGLELIKKEQPDLVMLDVILPQIDGFSVLEELKKEESTKLIPVIMLTNLGTEEDKDKGEKMGAVDYLIKASLTPAQLSIKIKKYLKI
ncbi:MAG: response regulator [Patescibacteria group bacterium]|nr:response regulator [Patescibacteria group bacterium]MBU1871068.1 response regulator [Patescibacteria group bacterium]